MLALFKMWATPSESGNLIKMVHTMLNRLHCDSDASREQCFDPNAYSSMLTNHSDEMLMYSIDMLK